MTMPDQFGHNSKVVDQSEEVVVRGVEEEDSNSERDFIVAPISK